MAALKNNNNIYTHHIIKVKKAPELPLYLCLQHEKMRADQLRGLIKEK